MKPFSLKDLILVCFLNYVNKPLFFYRIASSFHLYIIVHFLELEIHHMKGLPDEFFNHER